MGATRKISFVMVQRLILILATQTQYISKQDNLEKEGINNLWAVEVVQAAKQAEG